MAQVSNVSFYTSLTRSFLQYVPSGTVRQQDVVKVQGRRNRTIERRSSGESYRVTSHMLCSPNGKGQPGSILIHAQSLV